MAKTLDQLSGVTKSLDIAIRARFGGISVDTHEEQRLIALMRVLRDTTDHKKMDLYTWSHWSGLAAIAGPIMDKCAEPEKLIADSEGQHHNDPHDVLDYIAKHDGLFVLCDFAPWLAPYGQADEQLVRHLRELLWQIKGRMATILFVGPEWPEIPTLDKGAIKPLDLPLPDEAEIEAMLELQLGYLKGTKNVKIDLSGQTKSKVVGALRGLTETEVENALAEAIVTHRGLHEETIPTLLEAKRDAIRRSGSLTFKPQSPESDIGGYSHLKGMLHDAALTFSHDAREFGVERAPHLLLVGPPGVGKTRATEVASGVLSLPLYSFDFGMVMGEGGGIVGQGAAKLNSTLKIIKTNAPCIVGVDEFEKGFGDLKDGRSDGGETRRTATQFLTFAAEPSDVFIIATANDVRGLPPEMMREGRFTAVFVDFPTEEERAEIFKVWLNKKGRDASKFDVEQLASETPKFSGAEIKAAVLGSILDAYKSGQKDTTTALVSRRIKTIVPIGVSQAEEIEENRKWAAKHLNAVLTSEAAQTHMTVSGKRTLQLN